MKNVLRLALLAALSAACRSAPYVRYAPAPLEAWVQPEETPTPLARALLSVRGLREREAGSGPAQQAHLEMVLRVRLENRQEAPMRIEPDGCRLLDGGLAEFGAPRISSPEEQSGDAQGWEIAPHAARVFELAFPLPAGRTLSDLDLESLSLTWVVSDPRGRITLTSSFARVHPDTYYYGGWDPWWHDPWCGPHWHGGLRVGASIRLGG
jgi:hypothetical protein